jgi:hypothetical protein
MFREPVMVAPGTMRPVGNPMQGHLESGPTCREPIMAADQLDGNSLRVPVDNSVERVARWLQRPIRDPAVPSWRSLGRILV